MHAEPLYEEPTFRIDADAITIHRYYFPIGAPKIIPRTQVRSVEVRSTNLATRWRLWGSTNLTSWLPLEMGRPRKTHLVELDVGKRIRPTITPDDHERVAALLSD